LETVVFVGAEIFFIASDLAISRALAPPIPPYPTRR
jgi:hypothetical protein